MRSAHSFRQGSSPRVRGAGKQSKSGLTYSGIIPACAGSRHSFERSLNSGWDHPRVCGEQSVLPQKPARTKGSSPRVRGADMHYHIVGTVKGIIPACAGSSAGACTGLLTDRDHPRVCGEQIVRGLIRSGVGGSSPRVRGAGFFHTFMSLSAGIIPACAGSSAVHVLRA